VQRLTRLAVDLHLPTCTLHADGTLMSPSYVVDGRWYSSRVSASSGVDLADYV